MASYANYVSPDKLLDGAHHMHLVGRANCVKFARLERVAALLQARGLTEIQFMLQPVHPSQWEEHCRALSSQMGFPEPSQDPIVFTDTGRFLGPLAVFEDLVLRKYGVECDLDDHRLREIAQENLETATRVMEEQQVVAGGAEEGENVGREKEEGAAPSKERGSASAS